MLTNEELTVYVGTMLTDKKTFAVEAQAYQVLFHLVNLCKVAFCSKLFISIVIFIFDDSILFKILFYSKFYSILTIYVSTMLTDKELTIYVYNKDFVGCSKSSISLFKPIF